MSLKRRCLAFFCFLVLVTGCHYVMAETAPPKADDLGTTTSARQGRCGPGLSPIFNDHIVFDHFNTLPLFGTPGGVYWWVNNWGDGVRNDGYWAIDDSASVSLQREGCTRYAQLSLYPDATPGSYSNADITDVQDPGNHADNQLPWKAAPGHPVILMARLRWQGNYNTDGTGAIGTSGVAIWNHAYGNNAVSPINYFGLSWSMQGTAIGEGFAAIILYDSFPIAIFPAPENVDFKKWVRFRMVWSVNPQGEEFIRFWLNGKKWGTKTQLPGPMPETGLGIDLWNDNQLFTFDGVTHPNPPAPQHLDFDFVHVIQP